MTSGDGHGEAAGLKRMIVASPPLLSNLASIFAKDADRYKKEVVFPIATSATAVQRSRRPIPCEPREAFAVDAGGGEPAEEWGAHRRASVTLTEPEY
jgi:hypothetical protein